MVKVSTVFEYGQGGGLTVFLDPLSESSRCLTDIRRLAPICLKLGMEGRGWWKSVVFEYGQGGGLTVFLDPLSESSRCLPDIRLAPICLAFPVVDNILLVSGDFVFGMHQHGLEGVHSFETNLYIAMYLNIFLKNSLRPGK